MQASRPLLHIQAVLVLYKTKPSVSKSFLTLSAAVKAVDGRMRVSLLVYDNSPTALSSEDRCIDGLPFDYRHDSSNGGLVRAYNSALSTAQESGREWLLLLDQDTELPATYFETFLRAYPWLDDRIACVLPRVHINGKFAEPKYSGFFHASRFIFDAEKTGPVAEEISSINSASFVNVPYLIRRGGYPSNYWLDAVDFWFFAEAYRSGMKTWLLDTHIDHDLSTSNLSGVPIERWRSIVASATAFQIHMRGRGSRLVAAFGGLTHAVLLVAEGQNDLAAVRLKEAYKLFASLAR